MKNSVLLITLITSLQSAWAFPPITAQFGTGYDSLANQELGQRCVQDETQVGTNRRILGQRYDYSMTHITSLQSLKKELGVEVNASFGFGVYNGNFKVAYTNSEEFNQYSSFMVIKVRVENQTESLNNYILSDWAKNLLEQQGPIAFFNTCGDSFVAGETTGGEMIAVVSFTTSSREKKEQLISAISASAPFFRLNGTLSTSLREFAQNTSHSIKIFSEGGANNVPVLDDLQSAINNFPSQVDATRGGRPWVLDMVTRPYRVAQNLNTGFLTSQFRWLWGTPTLAGSLVSLDTQKHLLNDLSSTRDSALVIRNSIRRVLNHPSGFTNPDLHALTDGLAEVNILIDRIGRRAELCTQDPHRNCDLSGEQYLLPQVILPVESSGDVQSGTTSLSLSIERYNLAFSLPFVMKPGETPTSYAQLQADVERTRRSQARLGRDPNNPATWRGTDGENARDYIARIAAFNKSWGF